MSRLRRVAYFIEPFTYDASDKTDARQRPTIVLALLRSGVNQPVACMPDAIRQKTSTSLAMLGNRRDWDDTRDNDHFLPQFDHGHLLGAQYGGGDESFNLVPMLRRTNRGGAWAAFETAIKQNLTPAIVVMRCRYDDLVDPRIPSSVEAALIPIDWDSSCKLDDEWDGWRRNLRVIVKQALPGMIGQRVASQLRPAIKTDEANVMHASFSQEPFQMVGPPLVLIDRDEFERNLQWAIDRINATGWLVENDERARCTRSRPAPRPGTEFRPAFSLPPCAYRPYAALDLLALEGRLNGRLEGGDDSNINIANSRILTSATFNAEMRSFAKYMNLFVNRTRLSHQMAYLSDAAAYPNYPDRGPSGDGIVLDPEFDHIIPRDLNFFLGWPGPTVFSNLQLTSPSYNSRKSNNLWVQPAVTVGEIRQIIRVTRGATRRATAEGDVNRVRYRY